MAFEVIIVGIGAPAGTLSADEAQDFFKGRRDYDDFEFRCPNCTLVYVGICIKDKGAPYAKSPHFRIMGDEDHAPGCDMADKVNSSAVAIGKTLKTWSARDCREIPEELVIRPPRSPRGIAIPGNGSGPLGAGVGGLVPIGGGSSPRTRPMTTVTIKGIVGVWRKVIWDLVAAKAPNEKIKKALQAIRLKLSNDQLTYNSAFSKAEWPHENARIYYAKNFGVAKLRSVLTLSSASVPPLSVDQPAHLWHGYGIEVVLDFDAAGRLSEVYRRLATCAATGKTVDWWVYAQMTASPARSIVVLKVTAPAMAVIKL